MHCNGIILRLSCCPVTLRIIGYFSFNHCKNFNIITIHLFPDCQLKNKLQTVLELCYYWN